MQVRILGTLGEIRATHPKHLLHSGILIDKKILLDVGEMTFLKYKPLCIFITHLHPDHAFFMSPGNVINPGVPVFAPERSERLKTMHIVTGAAEFDGYKITSIPVIHSIKVKSMGYLIEKRNKRIFYTGDIISIKKKYLKRLTKLDLVITEASFFRKGGLIRKNKQGEIFGHAGVQDLVNLFAKRAAKIVFTHFGTWFLKDITTGRKKIKSLEGSDVTLDIAVDGATFEI
jgi:ribonuclease BN (tRNA processing enzyme)